MCKRARPTTSVEEVDSKQSTTLGDANGRVEGAVYRRIQGGGKLRSIGVEPRRHRHNQIKEAIGMGVEVRFEAELKRPRIDSVISNKGRKGR
jgi:hypothetical protein